MKTLLTVACVAAMAAPAVAQSFEPVRDRDYSLEIYRGVAIGSTRIVGMGGTSVASGERSEGTVANPAAASLRTATADQVSGWDWHLDWITPLFGTDLENDGSKDDGRSGAIPVGTLGVAYQGQRWGFALVSGIDSREFDEILNTRVLTAELMVGRNFFDNQLSLAMGFRIGHFSLRVLDNELFTVRHLALRAGALIAPHSSNFRFGVQTVRPTGDLAPEDQNCDPNACEGYVIPESVVVPRELTVGVAYRFANSRWSDPVTTRWRDERYFLVEGDLLITEATGSFGVGGFADQELQPAGRKTSVGVRVGAEWENIPGYLRLRAGSYFEPSRFKDEAGVAIDGRWHGTAGVEVRLFDFHMFGRTHRARLAVSIDLAKDYVNVALSPGLWY